MQNKHPHFPVPTRWLLTLTLAWVWTVAVPTRAVQADEPLASVVTRPLQKGPIAQTIRAYGVMSASPGLLNTMSVPYTARISRVWVSPGQAVARGQALFEVEADPSNVLAASQAGSALALAQGELARTRALLDSQLATQSQLANAQKSLADAQQAYAAQQRLGISAQKKTIGAPFDAVVAQVTVTQGDQVQPGAPILQIARAKRAAVASVVVLGVDPAGAANVQPGDTLTVRDLASGQVMNGQVTTIASTIDNQTQLVDVTAAVEADGARVFAGSKVVADIAVATQTHWIVPRSAVLQDAQGEYVYQVQAGKAYRIKVKTAIEHGDSYGVDGKLDPRLAVVVSGNYELRNGMMVRTGGDAPQ
jgi:RND family efflux transporter MFP subunit